MRHRKQRPKRSVGPSTRSERQIIANKHTRRTERKKKKHKHSMFEEEKITDESAAHRHDQRIN